MQLIQQDSTRGEWSERAIRDTVAAIARAKAYHRQLSQSLWDRLARWIVDRVNEFADFMSRLPHGRELTIGVIVLIIALIVVRVAIGIRDERALRGGSAVRSQSAAVRGVVLSDAERLAAVGDYTAAAHALFLALINASASRGEVRAHPSKTSGDYARELRRRNVGWWRAFQSFRSRYDRVMYGDRLCSADDYRALEQDVRSVLASQKVS